MRKVRTFRTLTRQVESKKSPISEAYILHPVQVSQRLSNFPLGIQTKSHDFSGEI